jgi:hypothetical protein
MKCKNEKKSVRHCRPKRSKEVNKPIIYLSNACSFTLTASKLWNSMDPPIRALETFSAFKNIMKNNYNAAQSNFKFALRTILVSVLVHIHFFSKSSSN